MVATYFRPCASSRALPEHFPQEPQEQPDPDAAVSAPSMMCLMMSAHAAEIVGETFVFSRNAAPRMCATSPSDVFSALFGEQSSRSMAMHSIMPSEPAHPGGSSSRLSAVSCRTCCTVRMIPAAIAVLSALVAAFSVFSVLLSLMSSLQYLICDWLFQVKGFSGGSASYTSSPISGSWIYFRAVFSLQPHQCAICFIESVV